MAYSTTALAAAALVDRDPHALVRDTGEGDALRYRLETQLAQQRTRVV